MLCGMTLVKRPQRIMGKERRCWGVRNHSSKETTDTESQFNLFQSGGNVWFLLLFQFSNSDQPGPDNSTISPLDQWVFIFPAPLAPNATPPPATRIGYRKTKLLYLCSLGKTAKEKLICSCTMVLLILSSSPLSFSYSFIFSFISLFARMKGTIKVHQKRKKMKT